VSDLRRNDTTGHLRYGRWTLFSYPEDWVAEDEEAGGPPSGGAASKERETGTFVLPGPNARRPSSDPRSAAEEPPADVRPLVDLLEVPLPWWKRAIDVAGSLAGLVLLSPVIGLAALAVKLTSPGPAFYASERCGVRGRPFRFYKLRSMYLDAEQRKAELAGQNEASGPVFKMTRDPRVTPVGRFLRKTSIDELPQLWNVLRGDMSLVGPRPPIPDETRFYAPWQRRRLEGKGGLTCFWQVSGRSNVQFEDWVRMDLRYLEKRSIWRDLLILVQTVPAVFSCRGAK
jgi:lipopolysaccharide/colanic/teichoic acid biosynthesis glycosyltransferase